MGLTVETLRATFPRTSKALDAHYKLIDQYVTTTPGRQRLKLSSHIVAITAAEEAGAILKHVTKAFQGADFLKKVLRR